MKANQSTHHFKHARHIYRPSRAERLEQLRNLLGWTVMLALSALSIWALFIREQPSRIADNDDQNTGITSIRIHNPPGEMLGGTAWSKALTMVYRQFKDDHPEYDFVPSSNLLLPGALSGSTDVLAFIGETAPDIFALQDIRFSPYIEEGFARPLNSLMDTHAYQLPDEVPDDLRKLLVRDGQCYGLPGERQLWGLTYRKDLYREAGLDPEVPPKTWDDLYEHCMKLTGPVTSAGQQFRRVGLLLDRIGNSRWGDRQFACFLLSAGGQVMEQDDQKKWHPTFQNQAGIEALDFYRRLLWGRWMRCPVCGEPVMLNREDGHQICTDEELQTALTRPLTCRHGHGFTPDAPHIEIGCAKISEKPNLGGFQEGHSAIQLLMPALTIQNICKSGPRLSPYTLGVAPMPLGPGMTEHRAYCEYHIHCMNGALDEEKDAARITAAWDYLTFITSDKAQHLKVQAYIEEGEHQYVNPGLLEKFGYREALRDLPSCWVEGYAAMERSARAIPPFPQYRNVVEDAWSVPIGHVFLYPDSDPALLLDDCARMVKESVMAEIPPEKMRRYRHLTSILVGAIGLLVAFLIARIIAASAQQIRSTSSQERLANKRSWNTHLSAGLLLAPAVLLVTLWGYFPVSWGTLMAFFDFKILEGFLQGQFVGFDNFIHVVLDPLFFKVMLNTAWFVGINILLGFTTPIILALLLTEIPIGRVFFRTVFFLPAVTSSLVVVLLWTMFFSSDESGVLNRIIIALGGAPQNWLGDPHWAMLCTIIPGVWSGAGPGCLIYLAALKSVPEECYEAADIDGAGFFTKVRNITLPVIWPLILINFLGVFIRTMQGMGNILLMTGGGPLNATRVLGLEIWMKAFINLDYGRSTSLAWILGSLLIGFTVMQLRLVTMMKFSTTKEKA